MSNRILPAVKRYAVETESVRDAAKVRGEFGRTPQMILIYVAVLEDRKSVV